MPLLPVPFCVTVLQWGLDQMIEEIYRDTGGPPPRISLQWGLDQMIEEMQPQATNLQTGFYPSMGPRSDDRGNDFQNTWGADRAGLQWGLDQMIEEIISTCSLCRLGKPTFNGASNSDDRGNVPPASITHSRKVSLQWGLDQMIEEIRTPGAELFR